MVNLNKYEIVGAILVKHQSILRSLCLSFGAIFVINDILPSYEWASLMVIWCCREANERRSCPGPTGLLTVAEKV